MGNSPHGFVPHVRAAVLDFLELERRIGAEVTGVTAINSEFTAAATHAAGSAVADLALDCRAAMRHHLEMQRSTPRLSLFLIPSFLAAAGAISRWTFQLTETRLQIAVFVILAGAIEIFSDDFGYRSNWGRFALSVVTIVSAIIAVRLHLEGPPRRISEWLSVRH
jgi:hypothetical protein